jgi:hypothetical protein|tara:strand:+ start:2579 stop:4423 length:1845 start_codon:yes stop_codon:yes gene_type:complete
MARSAFLLLLITALPVIAGPASYSPDAHREYPNQVFWGDTHVHTSFSSGDAYYIGANVITPTIAYRFARGETVIARNGMPARIRRPLDFLVIADHAEGLGLAYTIREADPDLSNEDFGTRLGAAYRGFQENESGRSSVWQRVVERADAHDDPGKFTAFIGYEWSSPGSIQGVFGNLHRVVIFKDGAEKTGRIIPFSSMDSRNPEDLWAFLARYEEQTGGQVLAIPHNPNLSNGEMFPRYQFDGSELTKEWASRRARYEPLMEATQLKGDSEAHPLLSPTDEFADFETWHSWAGYTKQWQEHPCCAERSEADYTDETYRLQKQGEYARPALKRGLEMRAQLGVNPYKFGLIGSTDTHTSFASADNDNFWGQYPNTPPSATRATDRYVPSWKRPYHWETVASGYAAVWAQENTRESLFAAMQRREVYATTGPRIALRFFGGWDFQPDDAFDPNLARVGYSKGIPMGGDLRRPDSKASPSFLIGAMRDPDGANLDRIQVIKGWRDASGNLQEAVYDVALSDGRKLSRRRTPKPVGSTVNVADASYSNDIGAAQLTVVWEDPDFQATEAAFYYVRVIEIPTPRWTAYDAKYFGIKDLPEDVVMVTQERAYTSPIWYTP